jgi:hypothetical protein
LIAAAAFDKPVEIANDFSKELAAPWVVSSKEWKIENEELVGTGGGTLEYQNALSGDFALTFDGWSSEKTNFEVKLYDKDGKKELYTFAFMGRYHSVLDGPKSCILKGDAFVKKDSKMWIFPGRKFEFEIRRAKNQFQMFLNGELGPVFVDDAGPALDEFRFKILANPEGKKDVSKLDNVKVVLKK